MTDECRPTKSTEAGTFLEFWTHVNEVRAANGDKPMLLADANRAWLIRENDKLRAGLAAAQHALRDVTVTGLNAAWLTRHWTAVQDARKAAGLDVWQPWMAEGAVAAQRSAEDRAKGLGQPASDEDVARVVLAANSGSSVSWDKTPNSHDIWRRMWVPQARAELARLGLTIVRTK